ncbi:YitT family protein [Lactococcus cremoris]|uniref:YitT family protein n=1 Tax=Lactococcus lactis subsp. cremoris TaxID=1359 RepID=A0AAX4AIR0_LACLC|nr:YitT family protein [Lactococcus cremoris]KGH34077.1 transporter [Lactococcus cremoris]QSE63991.1 YitT family protein [Lactococcus cremoris]WMX69605.1 YitT family protein [Lactococcus cremoris]
MTLIGVKIDRLFLRDLFILLIGVGLYILSIQLFVVPNAMASNGIAGFSVFIHFVFGLNPALTFFAVNIPLFLVSWKLLEQRELLLTIPGALAMSGWMMIYEAIGITGFQMDSLIAVGVIDGILSGIGAGLVVLSQGTFGGSILLARLFENKWKISIDKTLFGIDIVVMLLALITYLALPNFFVTLLSCFIFSKVTRFIGRPSYRQQVIERFGLRKRERSCTCATSDCSCPN